MTRMSRLMRTPVLASSMAPLLLAAVPAILNSARQNGGVVGVALLGALLGEPASVAGAGHARGC